MTPNFAKFNSLYVPLRQVVAAENSATFIIEEKYTSLSLINQINDYVGDVELYYTLPNKQDIKYLLTDSITRDCILHGDRYTIRVSYKDIEGPTPFI